MNNGWIRLSRRLLEWQWHDEPNMVALWVHLLLRANYEPTKYHGMTIEAGQLVTTLKELSSNTGLSAMQVRCCLGRMTADGAIHITAKRRSHTIISIVNFAQYQLRNVTKSQPHTTPSKTDSYGTQSKRSQHYYNNIVTLKKHQRQHYYNKIKAAVTRSKSKGCNPTPTPLGHYYGNNLALFGQIIKNKEDNNIVVGAVVRACESEITAEAVQATAAEILSDAEYQPLILMRAKMTLEDALRAIPEFAAQCRCRNETHATRAALAEHLANWLTKKRHEYSRPTQSATGRPDGQCAPTSGAAAANAATAAEDERHRSVVLRAYELMAGGG